MAFVTRALPSRFATRRGIACVNATIFAVTLSEAHVRKDAWIVVHLWRVPPVLVPPIARRFSLERRPTIDCLRHSVAPLLFVTCEQSTQQAYSRQDRRNIYDLCRDNREQDLLLRY